MKHSIIADNIKCGGCANRIQSQLSGVEGVSEVTVSYEIGEVAWQSDEETKPLVIETLTSMGYPESGSLEGLSATGAKAKSYVSCAIGKMTENKD